ncbi:hypothetical protein Btru_045416 [Bulinus truncatus]|nr:hypothetical protein Btru_045416 [Bulinus truncatus]
MLLWLASSRTVGKSLNNIECANTRSSGTAVGSAENESKSHVDSNDFVDFLLLCVKLNKLEIAEKYGRLWKLAFEDEYNKDIKRTILIYSLKTERYNFIRHLTQQGLKLQKYITKEDIKKVTKDGNKKPDDDKTINNTNGNKSKSTEDKTSDKEDEVKLNILFLRCILKERFQLADILWRKLSVKSS